ncbi:restriction endonuclease [Niastella caeni]|uniref:Restriction endonuclease n=1 Tax=Niastella caeni TaxID=2569763 RepID=A0A4S8I0M0_9BACT|nr:restriction endonuclease [Niastella caeni]THU41231.1 restriction endonuclease [Niastella caeni]
MKEWRIFERLVALLTSDEYYDSFTVIPNARIKGHISQRKRQIDVLVDYRYNTDLSKRIIIDAKNRSRPVDIKEVEAFEGLMKDVGAQRGFIVCSNGYTKAAGRRAQDHIGIRLISPEQIEYFDLNSWDKCRNLSCIDGLVLWDATPGIIVEGTVVVQSTGKCDECGKFHVWCWGCGNRNALGKEDEWQCACKGPWFWLTSIEPEGQQNEEQREGNYLILVMGNGTYEIIDRRPM